MSELNEKITKEIEGVVETILKAIPAENRGEALQIIVTKVANDMQKTLDEKTKEQKAADEALAAVKKFVIPVKTA